jgi:hypothetical protein
MPNLFTEKKRPQNTKSLRPLTSNDDADESRAKSLGKQSGKSQTPPPLYNNGGKRRKRNNKKESF